MQTLTVASTKKEDIIDITAQIEKTVPAQFTGICNIYTRHATAAIVINENWDPSVLKDILTCLDKLIPQGEWTHDKVDGNGAAHIKSAILGPGETLPVKNGKLLLGKWQGIGLVELDGPREREIVVTFAKTAQ